MPPLKKTQSTSSTSLAKNNPTLADVSKEIAERNAHALVEVRPGMSGVAKLAAFQKMLETPFVSGKYAAEQEAIVEILNVAPGQVEKIGEPGTMVEQWLYLVALQKELVYIDSKGDTHEHDRGDVVLIGLARNGVRDKFAEIIREAVALGETFPNLLVTTVPSKHAGFAPAVTFRQLGLD